MFKEKLAKLVSVKSIITIFLTGVFCYLSLIGAIVPDRFMDVFMIVVAFYFGTQAEKKSNTL